MGWVDRMHPLTGTNLAPMALVVVAVAIAVGLAAVTSSRRDLGEGVWPSRDSAVAKTALLNSPFGLALRLLRGSALAWAFGVGLFAAVFGTVSTAVSDAFADNKAASDIFTRMGAELSAKGYVGVTFVMISALLGLTAASFIGASRAEEADGRLEYLTAGPLTRRTWLATRTVIAAGALLLMACVVGFGGWLGVVASGGHISFGDMMVAGLNVVGPGLLVLGLGTLAYGITGRAGSAVAYAVVAWSFLVEMIGALVRLNHLIVDTSIIHHLAAAPAATPRWNTTLVMIVLGASFAAGGAVALQRRDIAPG
jgi:ABC-2 type transport system permease protein